MQSLLSASAPILAARGSIDGHADELLRALGTHTPVGLFMSDRSGACLFVNERWSELTGLGCEQALGDGWASAIHPDDRERITSEWTAAAATERDSVIDYRFLRPDGSVAWIKGYATAFRRDDGELAGWIGSCLDVTAERLAEQALRAERQTFLASFDDAPVGMALVSPGGGFLRVNSALCELLGYGEADLLARCFQEVTDPADLETDVALVARLLAGEIPSYRLEKRYIRADGDPVWAALSVSLIRADDGTPMHFVAHVEDIEQRKLDEQRLRHEADNDALTGLPNRRRFLEEFDLCTQRLARHGGEAALILLDVDRFKDVNDTHGHAVGDDALIAVANVLRGRLRETDVVARFGGDEFVILAPDCASPAAQLRLAADLIAAVRGCGLTADGAPVELTVSAGLACVGRHTQAVRAFEDADRGLYEAKRAGRNRVGRAVLEPSI